MEIYIYVELLFLGWWRQNSMEISFIRFSHEMNGFCDVKKVIYSFVLQVKKRRKNEWISVGEVLLYNNNKPIKPFPNGKIRFENRMYFFIEFDHIINTITSNRMDNCQTTVLCGFLTTLANLIKPWFSIGTVNVNRWMPFLLYPSWLLLLLLLCRAFSSHENKMWSSLYIMFYCKKREPEPSN